MLWVTTGVGHVGKIPRENEGFAHERARNIQEEEENGKRGQKRRDGGGREGGREGRRKGRGIGWQYGQADKRGTFCGFLFLFRKEQEGGGGFLRPQKGKEGSRSAAKENNSGSPFPWGKKGGGGFKNPSRPLSLSLSSFSVSLFTYRFERDPVDGVPVEGGHGVVDALVELPSAVAHRDGPEEPVLPVAEGEDGEVGVAPHVLVDDEGAGVLQGAPRGVRRKVALVDLRVKRFVGFLEQRGEKKKKNNELVNRRVVFFSSFLPPSFLPLSEIWPVIISSSSSLPLSRLFQKGVLMLRISGNLYHLSSPPFPPLLSSSSFASTGV